MNSPRIHVNGMIPPSYAPTTKDRSGTETKTQPSAPPMDSLQGAPLSDLVKSQGGQEQGNGVYNLGTTTTRATPLISQPVTSGAFVLNYKREGLGAHVPLQTMAPPMAEALLPPVGSIESMFPVAKVPVVAAPVVVTRDDKMARLSAIAMKYELAGGAIAKLRQLEGYDIIVIADDSSSMREPAHEASATNPYQIIPSRWNELQQRVSQIAEIATCLDRDGIDVYFLNSGSHHNITTQEAVHSIFNREPHGYTPLTDVYYRVLSEKLSDPEKRILVIIATDGEPNVAVSGESFARRDSSRFESLLIDRAGYDAKRCPTTIMACTDNESEIGWLNDLDEKAKQVDVVDDYRSELKEVHAVQKGRVPFNEGDYVVKTLLGAIDPIYDNLDERKLTARELAEYKGDPFGAENKQDQCCVIS